VKRASIHLLIIYVLVIVIFDRRLRRRTARAKDIGIDKPAVNQVKAKANGKDFKHGAKFCPKVKILENYQQAGQMTVVSC
jgi:hypothetical protein